MAKGTVNKVIILGRLGLNPEVRTTQSGMAVASLSIATNDGMNDNITTEWHRVTVFGKSAEVLQKYATKGSLLYVEGRLRTNKWQDKNGSTQYSTEIIASNFQFVGGNSGNEGSSYGQSNQQASSNNFQQNAQQQSAPAAPSFEEINSNDFDDDIPF